MQIRRATVLGAGVMGAQIAAWLAAAGVRVHLLDLASETLPEKLGRKTAKLLRGKKVGRNAPVHLALARLQSLKPAPLTSKSILSRLIPGNFEDDLSVVADSDWVIEAIIEKKEYKLPLMKKCSQYLKPTTPFSTNTSGIPLAELKDGFPEHLQPMFLGTHFFNPPRYMPLVEIIAHGATDPKMVRSLSSWIEMRLGKGVVEAEDRINFIANRIGVFHIFSVMRNLEKHGLNFETVDALTGKLIGHPASATFRTMDVVGLDTFAHVADNVVRQLPEDPFYDYFEQPSWLSGLIKAGALGQKAGAGVYKKTKPVIGGKPKTVIQVLDLKSSEYVEQNVQLPKWIKEAKKIGALPERLAFIFAQDDPAANMLREAHMETMAYALQLCTDIAGGYPLRVDQAMKWGFVWEIGPFELAETLAATDYGDTFSKAFASEYPAAWSAISEKLKFFDPPPSAKQRVFAARGYGKQRKLSAEDPNKWQMIEKPLFAIDLPLATPTKLPSGSDNRVVATNDSMSLLDIGDGVAALSFHSKMNTVGNKILDDFPAFIAKAGDSFAGLVFANDGKAFCAGANISLVLELINKSDWTGIENVVKQIQTLTSLIKFSPIPVVTCPQGLALGGGCEIAIHGDRILAHAETYMGLVELGVGLIPAAGGCKEYALAGYSEAAKGLSAGRAYVDPLPFIQKYFLNIGLAAVSASAQDALEKAILPANKTQITFSRRHQTSQAKFAVMQLLQTGYSVPDPRSIKALGAPGIATLDMMLYNMQEGRQISAYDRYLAKHVATVLCGGDVDPGTRVSEQQLLYLERQAFVECCQKPETKARIEHMLTKGKPLRN